MFSQIRRVKLSVGFKPSSLSSQLHLALCSVMNQKGGNVLINQGWGIIRAKQLKLLLFKDTPHIQCEYYVRSLSQQWSHFY